MKLKGSLDKALALLNGISRLHHPKPAVRPERQPKIRQAAPEGFSIESRLDDRSLENLRTCLKR